MKFIITFILVTFSFTSLQAQLLKKLKQKAEKTVDKVIDKTDEKKPVSTIENNETNVTGNSNTVETQAANGKPNLKVYSKFDFVPGSSILYYDNFEKDNIGESPLGWITSSSAEVVTLDGLEGNWLQMAATSTKQISRNKKQSWSNNFTIEFDLLIVKKSYDPRISFSLMNSSGNLVTDEKILQTGKHAVYVSTILGDGGTKSRLSLYTNNNISNPVSDKMSESLPYDNTTPVHISICVQGKRFRFWWNEKKIYDLQTVNEEYMPNQFGFDFGSVGGSDFYVSNIRVAKDIPDTRANFEEGKIISNLLFYTGKANLRPESMGALLDISKILKEASLPVKIVGHTDSDGDDAANIKLSQQRAEAVKTILVNQYNVDESKFTTEGRGETQPIADNKNAEGKAQNRRVEFIFKPEADVYLKPAGVNIDNTQKTLVNKSTAGKNNKSGPISKAKASITLQSKILNTSLPFAQFMKTSDNNFTFSAGKEEGNNKENYFKIELTSVNTRLKPETYHFKEINEKETLYGTKQFSEIKKAEAVLYYGIAQKPYIYKFSPIIGNGHMATFVSESLHRKLPPVSPNCKLVIENVEDGKASGYFVMGIMIQGLKAVTKGDAMQETFTDGFSGEIKCTFTNVPVY